MSEEITTTASAAGGPVWREPFRAALLAGLVALGVMVIGAMFDLSGFLRSYLFGYVFWLGVSLGAMGIVMMHHLTGGGWGYPIRRLGEAAGMVMPVLVILFIPIALGLHRLYPWADEHLWPDDPLLAHRRPLFNPLAMLIRMAIFFAIWCWMAWSLWRNSLAHDRAADFTAAGTFTLRMRRTSLAGLVLYFITMSLAAVDLVQSREAHWYSSVFGFVMIIGQSLVALCVLLLALWLFSRRPSASVGQIIHQPNPDHLHDLGNMLLMFVILWAYIDFSQLLVIWMGNTQEDITWYAHRRQGGWAFVDVLLIALHFFVPMLLLFIQHAKRRIRILSSIAAGLIVLHLLNVLWLIAPSSPTDEPGSANWMDLFSPIAIGGIWIATFLWLLKNKPLVPLGLRVGIDPETRNDGASETNIAARPMA